MDEVTYSWLEIKLQWLQSKCKVTIFFEDYILFCSLVQCLLENHRNPAIHHISEFDIHLDISPHDLLSLR